jgi:hypothetical protein
MAHGIASAGGGYVWPNVFFASDGDSIAVASIPRIKQSACEPIRYLNRILSRITATEFEAKVDSFIEGVLSRMDSIGITQNPLPTIWASVLEERNNSEVSKWRKMEALCGYDPDEAPRKIIQPLIQDSTGLGNGALEEVAAEGRHSVKKVLKPILDFAVSKGKPGVGGFRGKMPELSTRPSYEPHFRPWQKGSKLAQFLRRKWKLGEEPISDKQLATLFEIKPTAFSGQQASPTSIPIALRTANDNAVDFYFDSSWPSNRRFSAARLLGDHLHKMDDGRLIPATHAKTSRQQFQRAFAQEFLCPFNAILKMTPSDRPTDEDITKVAEHFRVSPLMVKTTLVNRGELDRDALAWAA